MKRDREPTEDARERGRQVLDAVVAVRGQVLAVLESLRAVLPGHLPEGTSVDETFVAAAEDQLGRGKDMMGLVQVELGATARPESLEIAITMLENLLESSGEIVRNVRGSLAPFVEGARVRLGRGGTASGPEGLERLEEAEQRLRACSERLTALGRSRRSLEEDARAAIAREAWARLAEVVDEDRLLSLWQQSLRGVGRFDRLAAGAGLDAEQIELFKGHLLSTALRLEAEVADFEREHRKEPEPEAADEGEPLGPPEERRPLVVKLSVPDPVALGEVFELVLLVRNDHALPVVLDSIDVDGDFLQGFEVCDVHPDPKERARGEGWTLEYESEIGPGDGLRITLSLRARRLGNHSGEISVWTSEVEFSAAVPNIDVVLMQ